MCKFFKSSVVVIGMACIGTHAADAYSSRGTPEYVAEVEAAGKVPGGYRVLDAQMRSTKLSISIPTVNAKGKRVNFECLVRKQVYRDGTIKYFTGAPQVSGSGH